MSNDPLSTLIPYRNGKALTAYYLGVFSLIPCLGLILGPIALVLGIKGLRYAQANPQAKGMGHAITGIVLGALTTLGNLGVLVLIVVGVFMSEMGRSAPATPPPPHRQFQAPVPAIGEGPRCVLLGWTC